MSTETKYCCEEFKEFHDSKPSRSPLAFAYAAAGVGDSRSLNWNKDGTYNIAGCCGGGCNVLKNGSYCPFCGSYLAPLDDRKDGKRPRGREKGQKP